MTHFSETFHIRVATAVTDLSRVALGVCGILAAALIALLCYWWGHWPLFTALLLLLVGALWLLVWCATSLPFEPYELLSDIPESAPSSSQSQPPAP